MSNQVIDNPTSREIACVTSSKLPACFVSDSLCQLLDATDLSDIQDISECSCPVNIIRDSNTGDCVRVEKTISTISFPQLSNYCRFRLPNNLSFTLDGFTAASFPLTWRMTSLVIDGVERVTSPLSSRIIVTVQADIRGFAPGGGTGSPPEGGVVQEVEAFNDFFKVLGLSNAFYASSPTELKYVPFQAGADDLNANFIIHWNPCVVTTWFRMSVERVWVNEATNTYTYQVNDPAPPAGASTDQLRDGSSFSGSYGGTSIDVFTLATNRCLK